MAQSEARPPLRLVLIGWGAIGQRLAALVAEHALPVRLVAVAVADTSKPRTGLPAGTTLISRPEDLAAFRPDLVIEAAGRASVAVWAEAALGVAREVAIASTSAFVDGALLDHLLAVADRHGARLTVPSGAIGAVDALAAASLLPLERVTHQVTKPPAGWRGTAAQHLLDLDGLTEPAVFFAGSAREAADRFPQNANATVVTALAGVGLDRTEVRLVADPAARLNSHEISAAGAFGNMVIRLTNQPLATNPRSSELTALSLAQLVRNRCRALQLG
jgi:aspartate dehydrogenase